MGNHSSILKILQERGRMKFVFGLVALFVAVCSVSAKERAECSFEQAAACVTEIGVAWDSCQSFTNPDEILACMEQIVGATDCWDCVCVVLDFLLLYQDVDRAATITTVPNRTKTVRSIILIACSISPDALCEKIFIETNRNIFFG